MFQFLALVHRDDRADVVTLTLVRDDKHAELSDGDQLLTVQLEVDPFNRPVRSSPEARW